MELTDIQKDVLTEVFNIGVGRASSSLSDLVTKEVKLEVPEIDIIDLADVPEKLKAISDRVLSIVEQKFACSFSGKAALIFPTEDASKLVAILSGEEIGSSDLDSVKEGTITEVGNIIINGLLGSVSNFLEETMDFTLPLYQESHVSDIKSDGDISELQVTIICKTKFEVQDLQVEGHFMMYINVKAVDKLLALIDKKVKENK